MQSLQIPSSRNKFPLSSPPADDQASVRSHRSGSTYLSHDPSRSPYSTMNPFADDESDTSGHDEFHLERYSQGLEQAERRRNNGSPEAVPNLPNRDRSESPRKKPRPGLNIVTDFSAPPPISLTDGTVVEEVQNQRPRLRSRPRTSVVSHKAEHCYQPSQSKDSHQQDFINLRDLTDLKKKAKKDESKRKPKARNRFFNPLNRSGTIEDTSAQQPDMTRTSVPKTEVGAQDATREIMLYAPATPQIVVTPAEENAPWASQIHSDQSTAAKRPTSSIYSQMTRNERSQAIAEDVPPVPTVPKKHVLYFLSSSREAGVRADRVAHASGQGRPVSTDTLFDDDDGLQSTVWPRFSSTQSEQQIPPERDENERPKSNGWWNLGLSPLLSRAGTVRPKRSPSEPSLIPAVPTIPFDIHAMHEEIESIDELSPVTPRRLGIGSTPGSTWTNWTEWENERSRFNPASHTTADDVDWKAHKAHESSATVPFMIGATPIVKGLAAEYFTACAFDLRGTTPFFECQNHSCSEGLPKLLSIHDKRTVADLPQTRDIGLAGILRQRDSDQKGSTSKRQPSRSASTSTATEDDDEPTMLSPNVRKAKVGTMMRPTACAPGKGFEANVDRGVHDGGTASDITRDVSEFKKPMPLPAYSPPRSVKAFPSFGTAISADRQPPVTSPGPLSPEMQRAMGPRDALPMSEVQQPAKSFEPVEGKAPPPPTSVFINKYTNYPDLPTQTETVPVSLADIQGRQPIEHPGQGLEKEDTAGEKVEGRRRDRRCFPKNGWSGRKGHEGRKKRRLYVAIFAGLLTVVIASVVLAITLTRKGDDTPIDSQWLNLTGFPPMPTGISTVIRPDAQVEDSSCVNPPTLWSCALPKEDQVANMPNDPDQPNFRFEIRFRNGTVPANETVPITSSTSLRHRQNDPFTNDLYTPSPATSSLAEQIFLGNTTDNITAPFDGEVTPFYITFIATSPIVPSSFNASSRLLTRQANSTDPVSVIPPPDIASDGSAAPANLLPNSPFPSSQPIRLYNRGLSTEHYGFYSYYDKAIFLTTSTVLNGSALPGTDGVLPEDQNGGCAKDSAVARCTFSQTRFLVRIWTSPNFGGTVLPIANGSATGLKGAANANGSATDFTPPGSFPYPISITLDRHGGDASKKGLFCYGMDGGEIVVDEKFLEAENRASGGVLVNSAPGLISGSGSNGFDPNAGGIDGGTGGCSCEWANWEGNGN